MVLASGTDGAVVRLVGPSRHYASAVVVVRCGMRSNKSLERTGKHRGVSVPRFATCARLHQRLRWPAAQFNRYASRRSDQVSFDHARSSRGSDQLKLERLSEFPARHIGASAGWGVAVARAVASAEHLRAKQFASSAASSPVNDSWLAEAPTHNKSLQRTVRHSGRTVLAMDCVLAGAERAPCLAAEFNR